MSYHATHVDAGATPVGECSSVRMAVLELLAKAAPRPAALGAPSEEEQEFLDTLRRIVARGTADDIIARYNVPRPDPFGWVFARFQD